MALIADSERNLQKAHTGFYNKSHITRSKSGQFLGHSSGFRGCTVWFTGLSGAGKTTISFALEEYLCLRGIPTYSLDGDNMRMGLNKDLAFSPTEREENIRRASEVAKLFADAGIVCLASFISPCAIDRARARYLHEHHGLPFIECYVDTPLEVCESRDVKGLYKMARSGEIKDFTGIESVYEVPENPDLILRAWTHSVSYCVQELVKHLEKLSLIPGTLIKEINECFVPEEHVAQHIAKSASLPFVDIDELHMQWLQVLGEGWASPLNGFMREREYLQTLHFNCLQDIAVVNQSIPIVLPIDEKDKERLESQLAVALRYDGKLVAIMRNLEVFPHRKEERCCRQFGTRSKKHPYVRMIEKCGDWCLGGDLKILGAIKWGDGLDQYRLKPNELRREFERRNADAVFVFQVRNCVHNGHALIIREMQRTLLQRGYKRPVLLLHPIGGWTKEDDVPLAVRVEQHLAILDEKVIEPENTVLAIFPSPMMYAGPTEEQWHCRARMAAGATFYIVGHEHDEMQHPEKAGALYDPRHRRTVLTMAPGLVQLEIVSFAFVAYNKVEKKMDFFDANKAADFEFISNAKMLELARNGFDPPVGFMSPKAWKVLTTYYKNDGVLC